MCWREPEQGSWLTDAKVSEDGQVCSHCPCFHFGALCWILLSPPQISFLYELTEPVSVQYLVLSISEGCDPVNRLYLCDLSALPEGLVGFRGSKTLLPFQKLVDSFEAQFTYVANDGPVFTFFTNQNAPKYKIVRVDIENPAVWSDVIPESQTNVINSVDCVNMNQLLVCYISDVKHVLQIHDLETGEFIRRLPIEIGTVNATSGTRYDPEIFFNFTSFLTPGTVYKCDLSAAEPKLQVLREVGPYNFDRSVFETKQVYIRCGKIYPSF